MNKEEILKSKTDIDNGIVSTYDYTIYEAMEEYANQFKVEPSPEQDGKIKLSEALDYGEWARVNGERHRGNLQKNGIELFNQYKKEKDAKIWSTRW